MHKICNTYVCSSLFTACNEMSYRNVLISRMCYSLSLAFPSVKNCCSVMRANCVYSMKEKCLRGEVVMANYLL